MTSGARALIVDRDETHARAVTEVLARAVHEVESVTELARVPAGEFDLVVASFDGLGLEGTAALLQRFRELRSRGRVLLFIGAVDRGALAGLFGEHGLSNVLARSGDLDAADLLVTVQKILRGDVFGIDKYFPATARTHRMEVRASTERDGLLEATRAFALAAGAQGRFADLLCNACDEMLTNALYNAPVDRDGKPRYAHLSRVNPVTLEPTETVVVTLASDGQEMGISVVDPFGSLKVPTITQYLAKCLRRGSDLVDEKEGGAGLGLYYVFEAVSHFVVNLQAGARTEMIGIVDVRGRYKDFVQRAKSFNVFVTSSA
ncbi:MAG: hypothetical protein HYS27_19495 [Deltaproteobacteria bacterium]|nr:hypothetical protein [Deltaproteobacteria bacterium]